jgi:hypothetical protein
MRSATTSTDECHTQSDNNNNNHLITTATCRIGIEHRQGPFVALLVSNFPDLRHVVVRTACMPTRYGYLGTVSVPATRNIGPMVCNQS